jgi:two-component system chemotaxis response regulator CheB
MQTRAVVIGTSAGGFEALKAILPTIPLDFPVPIYIVQHMSADGGDYLANHLNELSLIHIKEAENNEVSQAATAYIAPGGYHLLVEDENLLMLSLDSREHYSRPSINVLFESAVDVYHECLIGIILTGANDDGSDGLDAIKKAGGIAIVQDPNTAHSATMPESAIAATEVDYILPLEEITPLLCKIFNIGRGK